MTRFDITTIGESMLRYSVPPGERLELAAQLDVHVAGAESNVASLLSRLGRRCGYISALPSTALGRLVANHLQIAGVDFSSTVWTQDERLGTYYVEFAVPPRATQVIYDRAGSAFAQLTREEVNWDYLLDTRLLHLTGITPALSSSCRDLAIEAVQRAENRGIAVSLDVNYREKLWAPEQAADTLKLLLSNASVFLCSEQDARRVFGFDGAPQEVVQQLATLTSARSIILTLSDRGVLGWDGTDWYEQSAADVTIIDRIGAGDALAAGIIHGWLEDDLPAGLRYGTILAALALSQQGDMVVTTPEEVASLLRKSGDGISR